MTLPPFIRNLLPNWLLLRLAFRRRIGYWPRLNPPRSYSERLLKKLLLDDGKATAPLADKVAVRQYVKERIGEQFLIPMVMVTNQPSDLLTAQLPKSIVVKSSSGSGMVTLIPDTSKAAWDELIPMFTAWLENDYSRLHRETVYAHVTPQLLVEEMLSPHSASPPADYKVYVFNGKARFLQLISGRGTDIRQSIYFPDGRPMPSVSKGFPPHDEPPVLTADLPQLIEISEALGAGLDFVRVDLYWVDGRVYFGELTFYPAAVRTSFLPQAFDEELGNVWLHGTAVDDKWASPRPL